MALDPEIKRMFRQTIYVARPRAYTTNGDAIYFAPTPILCRWEPAQIVTDTAASGEETVSDFLFTTDVLIGQKDHIWPPGINPHDHDIDARVPQRIDVLTDEDGTVSHYEVLV